MMDNIVYTTGVLLGALYLLKYASILNTIRDAITEKSLKLKELFSCGLCLGFWIGVGCWLLTDAPIGVALYSAAVCWLGDYAIQIIQKHLYK
jgi:hypothetical protein